MSLQRFDRRGLHVLPLAQRKSLLAIEDIALDPEAPIPASVAGQEKLDALAERIAAARKNGAAVILAYGAHLIKNGAGPLVRRLIEQGWVTGVATHGAGVIHDWEFAFAGRSSESVRENAPVGRFGTWEETGRWINLAVAVGVADDLGFGGSMGRFIAEQGLTLPDPQALSEQIAADPAGPLTAAKADLLRWMRQFDLPAGRIDVPHPYRRYSVPACCYEQGVAFTVHPGIGYDIFVNHPMFHAAALGRGAGVDTDLFAAEVDRLDGGVYLSVGSAIMSPQVFEKAFSAANNLRLQRKKPAIRGHTIAVVDLQPGDDWDWTQGEPPLDHPAYYLRFCKTFHRMGGRTMYLQEDNRAVLSGLLTRLG